MDLNMPNDPYAKKYGYEEPEIFDSILADTLEDEGGDTEDHRGLTSRGVSQPTYDSWSRQKGKKSKLVTDLDDSEVYDFYEDEFYKRPKINTLPSEKLQDLTFDYGVNASPKQAIKDLQSIVGSKPDGIIGSKTRKSIDSFIEKEGEQELLQQYIDKRDEHNKSLIEKNPGKYKKFEDGWNNRIQRKKDKFNLSFLNPFAATEVHADEIPDPLAEKYGYDVSEGVEDPLAKKYGYETAPDPRESLSLQDKILTSMPEGIFDALSGGRTVDETEQAVDKIFKETGEGLKTVADIFQKTSIPGALFSDPKEFVSFEEGLKAIGVLTPTMLVPGAIADVIGTGTAKFLGREPDANLSKAFFEGLIQPEKGIGKTSYVIGGRNITPENVDDFKDNFLSKLPLEAQVGLTSIASGLGTDPALLPQILAGTALGSVADLASFELGSGGAISRIGRKLDGAVLEARVNKFNKFIDNSAKKYVENVEKGLRSDKIAVKESLPPEFFKLPKNQKIQIVKDSLRQKATGSTNPNEFMNPKFVDEYLNAPKTPQDYVQAMVGDRLPSGAKIVFNEAGEANLAFNEGKALKSNLYATAITKLPGAFNGVQALNTLRNAGVTPEEIEFSGVEEWVKDKKKVTRDELLEFVENNGVEVDTVFKGTGQVSPELEAEQAELFSVMNDTRSELDKFLRENDNLGFDYPVDAKRELRKIVLDGGKPSDSYETNDPEKLNLLSNKITQQVQRSNEIGKMKGSDETKFSQYTIPGGENYKETLVTLPSEIAKNVARRKELAQIDRERILTSEEHIEYESLLEKTSDKSGVYQSPHFDEPNILVHLRTNDRQTEAGKTLFIEEVQSDWHQDGRKKGYKLEKTDDVQKNIDSLNSKVRSIEEKQIKNDREIRDLEQMVGRSAAQTRDLRNRKQKKEDLAEEFSDANNKLIEAEKPLRGVPNAPFKKTWHELGLKKAMEMAVDGGYDAIAWTSGEVQADRYDLSKQIDNIVYIPESQEFRAYSGDNAVIDRKATKEELPDLIGKSVADKLLASETYTTGMNKEAHKISGEDLKIGGEGMKAFYDKFIPKSAEKMVKRYDPSARIQPITINGQQVQSIPITDIVKQEVSTYGQPLFGNKLNKNISLLKSEKGEARIGSEEPNDLPDDIDVAPPKILDDIGKGKAPSQKTKETAPVKSGDALPPKPPTKTTFAMPEDPEGWDDAWESLQSETKALPTGKDKIEIAGQKVEAIKELQDIAKSIDKQILRNIKYSGTFFDQGSGVTKAYEEEKLLPNKFKNQGGRTLDDHADELSQELKTLGYEPTSDGLREYIQDYHVAGEAKRLLQEGKIAQKEYTALIKDVNNRRKEALRRTKAVEKALGKKGRSPKAVIRKKTGQVDESRKISMTEAKALKGQLKAEQKAALLAERSTKKRIGQYQKEAGDFIKSLQLPAKDRAKFLASIKRVTDKDKLDKELKNIATRAKEYADSVLKNNYEARIEKELDTTKPIKRSGRSVERYNYEDNKILKEMRDIKGMTKKDATDYILRSSLEPGTEEEKMLLRFASLKASGKQSSVQMYEQVLSDIDRMKHYAQLSKNEADFIKLLNRQEMVDDAFSGLDRIKANKDSLKTKFTNLYRKGFSNMYSMYNSVFGKDFAEMYDPSKAETLMGSDIYFATKDATDKGAEIYGIPQNDFKDGLINMSKVEEKFSLTDVDGNVQEMNKLQVIDIYNSIKNKNTLEQYHRLYGEERINELMKEMTPEDKRFADYLQEKVQDYRDVLNEKHIQITGRDLGFVENYWPRTSEKPVNIYDDFIKQSNLPSAIKQRAATVRPVPVNAWHKFNRHINQGEHVRHMSEYYENLNRILTDRKIKNTIELKYGEDIYRTMMDQLEEISLNGKTQNLDFVSELFGGAINNWVLAKIALNPGVLIKQLVSTSNYMENMPVGEWSKYFAEGVADPKKTFDFMWENAPWLEARFKRGYSEALSRAISDASDMQSAKDNWAQFLSSMTRSGDISAIIYGGYPMVKYHLAQGKSMKYAMDKFLDSTIKSQQSGVKSALSQFQNNMSPLTRLFLAFKNTPTQYMRKIFDNIIAYQNGDQSGQQTAKALTIFGVIQPMLWVFTSAAILEMYKGAGRAIRDEEKLTEENKLIQNVLIEIALSPVNAVPLLSDFMRQKLRGATGQHEFDPFDTPLLGDLRKANMKSKKNDITLEDYLTIGSTITEPLTGAPAGTVLRIGKYLFKPDSYRFSNFIKEEESGDKSIKQSIKFFNELNKAVAKKQIDPDDRDNYIQKFIKTKYDITGRMEDSYNIKKLSQMPTLYRNKLISTYAESTQIRIKSKINRSSK